MGLLSRKFATAAAAVVLASCATRPEPEAEVPAPEHWRAADIQSIPASAWIEQNNEAVGIAPMRVWVQTYSNGVPKRPVVLRAHDRFSGAWEQKVIATVPMPSRILFDLRAWMTPEQIAFSSGL